MKVAVFLVVVALVALALLLFDDWLVSDTQTHVIRASPAARAK